MKAVARWFRNTFSRVGIAGSLVSYFWRRKTWWMVPLVVMLLVLGVLVIFGQSSAISAFIYTIFQMITGSPAVQLGSTRREDPLPPGSPFYKHLWRGWQTIARWIGNQLSRVVTTFAFVVVLPIFAIGVRMFADPLALKPAPSRWQPHPPNPTNIDDARSGF